MNTLQALALGQIGLCITLIVYGIRISDLEKRAGRGRK